MGVEHPTGNQIDCVVDVGVTGTREGLTYTQELQARHQLLKAKARQAPCLVRFHHGDCIGADDELARFALTRRWWIVCHPPIKDSLRAWVAANEFRDPKGYLDRNRDIVDESDFLIACPKSGEREGGTWYTINYAREVGCPGVIVYPDGTTEQILESNANG